MLYSAFSFFTSKNFDSTMKKVKRNRKTGKKRIQNNNIIMTMAPNNTACKHSKRFYSKYIEICKRFLSIEEIEKTNRRKRDWEYCFTSIPYLKRKDGRWPLVDLISQWDKDWWKKQNTKKKEDFEGC